MYYSAFPDEFGFELEGTLPEEPTEGGLLGEIQTEQSAYYSLAAYRSSGGFSLYDDYPGVYTVPHSVPAYLSGSTPNLGAAQFGGFVSGSGSGSVFGFVPSTNAMTAHGLPDEKAVALGNPAQNAGPTDGVSQTATASPTSGLVVLAAAGRNPTDITLPTLGSEASGGGDEEDEAVAGLSGTNDAAAGPSNASVPAGSSSTTDDPASRSSTNAASAGSGKRRFRGRNRCCEHTHSTTTAAGSSGAASAGPSGGATAGGSSGSGEFSALGDEGGGGSHEVSTNAFGAFFYEFFVVQGGNALTAVKDTGQGLYLAATSSEARTAFTQTFTTTRVEPLAARLNGKAELRGIEEPGWWTLAALAGEDAIGATGVEAIWARDLGTGQEIKGTLFGGGERSERLANGISGFSGSVALGALAVAGIPAVGAPRCILVQRRRPRARRLKRRRSRPVCRARRSRCRKPPSSRRRRRSRALLQTQQGS